MADDIVLPVVVLVVGVAALLEIDTMYEFAKSKKGKSGEVCGAEHTSGARNTTKKRHEKGQARKQQKKEKRKEIKVIGNKIQIKNEYRRNLTF